MGGRNGVGSRFRPTIYHMQSGFSENDSRPLSPDSTKKYLAGCLIVILAMLHRFFRHNRYNPYLAWITAGLRKDKSMNQSAEGLFSCNNTWQEKP